MSDEGENKPYAPRCNSAECKALVRLAMVNIFWPGQQPLPMCLICAGHALEISQAMGFFLTMQPLPQGHNWVAP